jgi:tRNA (guanine26-N2/guanine27-N2)-dimethyltransferase
MFGGSPVKPSMLVEKLRELGYRASTTHIDPSGVKTDAPLEALRSAFEELRAKKLQ